MWVFHLLVADPGSVHTWGLWMLLNVPATQDSMSFCFPMPKRQSGWSWCARSHMVTRKPLQMYEVTAMCLPLPQEPY